jgi:ATP-dependent RNA circularization protein (DNA/RNA ligase family)
MKDVKTSVGVVIYYRLWSERSSMTTEYHKIETLYERDEKTFKIKTEMILKSRIYGIIKSWVWTEKIDGTNIRVIWQGGKLSFGGKTDNAQIHSDLVKWLYENITPESMVACFPNGENVVLYGEGYGAGIQKGGGNYSQVKQFILFDVYVIDQANSRLGGWWLSDENMRDVAHKLCLSTVPLVGEMTLVEAAEKVRNGFKSALNGGAAQAEGLVGRPVETLFDKRGHRLIVKLKTKDFVGGGQ